MPKSDNQKLKLLYIKEFLEQQTDETHIVNVQQIIAELERHGISAERKSIYNDIACLQDFGMDICQIRGKNGGYFLASRDFELPELELLVDAVQASRFLSEKKSTELISKLQTLTSYHAGRQLRRQVVVSGRVKSMNESIYYNVDRIHEAITGNAQISFQYFDWDITKEKNFRKGLYTASPYALCWDNENYYLIAHSQRHGITHFRVDKMARIQITDTPRFFDPKQPLPDLTQYGKTVFGMFGGDRQTVRLRFHKSLCGVILDRFGRDVMLIPDGEEHFIFSASITVSPVFFGWLAGFGANARILSPDSVVQQYLDCCRQSLQQYE